MFYNKVATFRHAPQSIDIADIRADSSYRDFKEALPLRRLKQQPFLLRKAMTDTAAADFSARRLAAAEALHIVLVRPWHFLVLNLFRNTLGIAVKAVR